MRPREFVSTYFPRLPRDHWRQQTEAMDPEVDHNAISRIVAQHEFPWDVQQALSFALFRTYAVPTIGGLLHETTTFVTDAQKRHDDTVLILATALEQGLESADGRTAVRRMNQMHGRYDISNDDLRYVLAAFVVMPQRWLDLYAWRRSTDGERLAGVRYYQRLGELMGIREIPDDYEGFVRLLDDYEAATFRPDPRTRAVADATLDLLTTFYWRPVRPAMRVFAVAIMDDHLREAFAYAAPPKAVIRLAHSGLRLRGRVVRWLPPRRRPRRAADLARIRSYPGGFLIEGLGTFATSDE